MEQILSTLGLALRAGSVAVGEEPVGSAARAKHARLILVASDAAPGSVRRAFAFAQTARACVSSFRRRRRRSGARSGARAAPCAP